MERLHGLLREKVRREKLTTAHPSPYSSSVTEGKTKKCWLCGHESRLRYRLRDTSSLCFPCFRIAYIALVLPFIDTPARRKSDVETLKRIAKMAEERRAAAKSPDHTQSNLGATWDSSVFDPLQASFVMSASRMRHRLQTNADYEGVPGTSTLSRASQPQPAASALSGAKQNAYWNCPRCTYVNPLSAKRCEACDFVNSTTVKCPHCQHLCPVDPEAAKAQRSVCSNGKPHVPWCCGECGQVNTLDGDACEHCKQERYWACTYCTALHNVSRSKDGLRYCATCGSYNTPEDVQKGQETIEAEHKRAKRAAGEQHLSNSGGGGNDVVFGVNDAETLAEQQRQKEIANNTARLNQRLDKLHIRRISQKSDGNCLFSALAHQLFGNENLHYLVRSCVVAYMRENAADYIILFDGEAEWSSYINQMRESGTWGDELCINAAARCFCVNIHVITSDPERWHMVFQQDELGKSETNLRDKLPLMAPGMDESPIASPPSQSATRTGRAATSEATSSSTLCLFLAYLYPVHFDDVTPTDVPSVVLSDLMIPELHKLLSDQGRSHSSATSAATRPSPSAPADSRSSGSGHATATVAATSSSRPISASSTSAASQTNAHTLGNYVPPPISAPLGSPLTLHSEQHQQRRGSAVATSATVERPVVPRARGPNSSPPPSSSMSVSSTEALDAARRGSLETRTHAQPPPPPPSHQPGSFRSDKSSGGYSV